MDWINSSWVGRKVWPSLTSTRSVGVRFLKSAESLDKMAKIAMASGELHAARHGSSKEWGTAKGSLGFGRGFVGLPNIFRGHIPTFYWSIYSIVQLAASLLHNDPVEFTNSSYEYYGHVPYEEAKESLYKAPKRFQVASTRGQKLAALGWKISTAFSTGGFLYSFTIRPADTLERSFAVDIGSNMRKLVTTLDFSMTIYHFFGVLKAINQLIYMYLVMSDQQFAGSLEGLYQDKYGKQVRGEVTVDVGEEDQEEEASTTHDHQTESDTPVISDSQAGDGGQVGEDGQEDSAKANKKREVKGVPGFVIPLITPSADVIKNQKDEYRHDQIKAGMEVLHNVAETTADLLKILSRYKVIDLTANASVRSVIPGLQLGAGVVGICKSIYTEWLVI